MVETAARVQQTGERAGTVPREWGVIRAVLLVVLGVVVIATALTATRPASMDDLHQALRSGQVTAVHLVGDLPPGQVGTEDADVFYQEIRWHDGLLDRFTTVPQDAQWSARGASQDLRAELTAASAGELSITREAASTGSVGYLFDWRVPTWVVLIGLAFGLVVLVTLFTSPTPRRATRWSWFWLMCGTGPLAVALYPLLGLPRADQPLRPTGRRLTGGWAFLLAVLLLGPLL